MFIYRLKWIDCSECSHVSPCTFQGILAGLHCFLMSIYKISSNRLVNNRVGRLPHRASYHYVILIRENNKKKKHYNYAKDGVSNYPQNVMPDENFGNLRGGGPLHKDMMFGEVIANVMGNFRIYSAGVYFDR